MKKRMLSLILALSLMFPTLVCGASISAKQKEEKHNKKIIFDEKSFDGQSFDEDTVLVVVNKSNSKINKVFEKGKFPGVNCEKIEDLTGITGNPNDKEYLNQVDFQQILKITLKKTGKDEVLKAIRKLERLDFVESAEPSFHVQPTATPNDPQYTAGNQFALNKINASAAWDITKGSGNVKVGIIDSGIASHSDLNAHVTSGYDFYTNNSTTTDDPIGHGTFIAGLIGATTNNNLGIAGINWNVTLVPLQVVITSGADAGKFSSSAIVSAINYSAHNDIPIINCSFGGLNSYNYYDTVMSNYKGLIVCSAGNDGINTDNTSHYPSCSTLSNVISVASTDSNDNLAPSSNYGATSVDIAAPGVRVYSTDIGNTYDFGSGTSYAAPHVAGVAALIKARYPDIGAEEIKTAILSGVDRISSLSGKVLTGGRLNAKRALDHAVGVINKKQVLSGDFNGDGKDDLVAVINAGYEHTQLMVNLSDGSSFKGWQIWWESKAFNSDSITDRVTVGDFNGDNKDDVAMMYDYGSSKATIFTFISNGNSFTSHNWYSWAAGNYNANNVTGRFAAGDFNGDGKDDLVTMHDYGSSKTTVFVQLSTGSGFSSSETWYSWAAGNYNANNVTGRFTAGDFNGDSKDDIAAMMKYPSGAVSIFVQTSTGSGFNSSQTWYSWAAGNYNADRVTRRFTSGDFNNDGKDDLSVMYLHDNNAVNIYNYISTGKNFANTTWYRWEATAGILANNLTNRFVAGDFNNDGKDDVVSYYVYSDGKSKCFVQVSNGSGFTGNQDWT